MTTSSWKRSLGHVQQSASRRLRSWFTPRRPHTILPTNSFRPLVEGMEDRTLLSSFQQIFNLGASQFANRQTLNTFLGDSFSVSKSFGGISEFLGGRFGAQATMSLGGRAGIDINFSGTGGNVNATYNSTLNQDFTDATGIGQVISFNPGNTFVNYDSGQFTTTSPSFGYGVHLVMGLNGGINAEIGYGPSLSGGFSFGDTLDFPLFSVNETNDQSVLFMGAEAGTLTNILAGLVFCYDVSLVPPVQIQAVFSEPNPLEFVQNLQMQLGLLPKITKGTKGGYTLPDFIANSPIYKVNAALDLGTLREKAPSISLNSTTAQSGGVLSASGQDTVAELDLQLGPMAIGLLGPLAALGSTSIINLGPIAAKFTPMSFALTPTLTAAQSLTVKPVNQLNYSFTIPGTNTPIMANVILNGTDLGERDSVQFTPGQDTLGIRFEGQPIQVNPTWNFHALATNQVDLNANLNAKMTVGKIEFNVPGVGNFVYGPLYEKTFNLANTKLQTLLSRQFDLPGQTTQVPSFVIGGNFVGSTIVTTTTDTLAQTVLTGGITGTFGSGAAPIQVSFTNASTPSTATPSSGQRVTIKGAAVQSVNGTFYMKVIQQATASQAGRFDLYRDSALTVPVVGIPGVTQIGLSGGTWLATEANGAPLNNSLRAALLYAHTLSTGTPAVIQLPAGIFGLTLPANTFNDGTGGELVVTGSNLTIAGAESFLGMVSYINANDNYRVLHVKGGAGLKLKNLVIEGGQISGDGGGILQDALSTLELEDSTVVGNTATGSGGGISSKGFLTLRNALIDQNRAGVNGIFAVAGQHAGGGVWLQNGTLVAENSTISGNRVTSLGNQARGGGLAVANSRATILSSTISENIAESLNSGGFAIGGGLDLFDSVGWLHLIANTTIAKNFAIGFFGANSVGGGAYFHNNGGAVYLVNDTVAGNQAAAEAPGSSSKGGIAAEPTVALVMKNTITANNSVQSPTGTPPIPGDLYTSSLYDAGNNLIETKTFVGQAYHNLTFDIYGIPAGQTGFDPTDILTTDPTLGSLSPSSWIVDNQVFSAPNPIMPPLPGSPVLDKGGSTFAVSAYSRVLNPTAPPAGAPKDFSAQIPTTDARGLSRSVGPTLDIGAVEYQYDLVVTGSQAFNTSTDNLTYTFQVQNKGPDQVANLTLTDALPAGLTYVSLTKPASWTESNPGVSNNGKVSITSPNTMFWGNLANLSLTAHISSLPSAPLTNSIIATPGTWDSDPSNSALNLHLVNEGLPFQNLVLAHFASPGLVAADFVASVSWGDGTSDSSNDGNGNLAVVANPNGGFDVLGSHRYIDKGSNNVSIQVTRPTGTSNFSLVLPVADMPLTSLSFAPPALVGQQASPFVLQNAVLYHFLDTNPGVTASGFSATVFWGDGTSNTTADNTGRVSVVSNPNGGFDVIGSHTYANGIVAAIYSVQVVDSLGSVLNNPVLFHFADGNPLGTVADFTAIVHWGDGSSSSSAGGNGSVSVVANPQGGFDVLGSHTYGQFIRNGTFTVSVTDEDGASTGATTNTFNVDYPLTAGDLTTPNVTTEGQSIQSALLFHFTDADPLGQASDFTANVIWADGSGNNSADGSNSVSVLPNANGGFVVFGSHTFEATGPGAVFGVFILDINGSTTGAVTADFVVADPAVVATGNFTVNATENARSGMQTVATFTDPGGANVDPLSGDIASTLGVGIAFGGSYPIAVNSPNHGLATGNTVTITGNSFVVNGSYLITVVDPSHFTLKGTAGLVGKGSGGRWVCNTRFTVGNNYAATINWGDGTTDSDGLISFNAGVFTVKGEHVYADPGVFPISVAITHGMAPTTTALSSAMVSNPALIVTGGMSVTGVEGQTTGSQTVATFTDPAGAEALTDYSASIGWGDVTSSTGTIGVNTNAPFTFASQMTAGRGPADVVVADLNNTGLKDIVIANVSDKSLQVFRGNGDGTFQIPVTYSLGSARPAAVAVADLNGDGHCDLVTANLENDSVSILLNDGMGVFHLLGQTLSTGTTSFDVAVADLNNDSIPDIVTANSGSNDVSVFLGTGGASFGTAQNYSVNGTNPVAIAIGLVDSGTALDLVVADQGSNQVSLLLGNGNGTFQTAQTFSVGTNPTSVALASLRGNGQTDIITANSGSNNVSVLLGNGNGTFGAAVNYATGASPVSVLVAPVRSGGALALFTANIVSNNVSVLLGRGNGTFHTATNYALHAGASAPSAVAGADLNGEGVLDLVTANSLSNDLTVLLPPYAVTGSHTYARASGEVANSNPYNISVSVDHQANVPVPATSFAHISEAPTRITANTGLSVPLGTTATVTSSQLSAASGPFDLASELVFTLTTATAHGTLKLNGTPLVASGSFTQDDIDTSKITYTPDGTGFTDSFDFSVADLPGVPATGTFLITITKRQPAFAGLNSETITYGTPSLSITGSLLADTIAATGNVAVTLFGNGITPLTNTPTLDANGRFSTTFTTATLPASPSSPYTVTYVYAEQELFLPASASTTLTIKARALTITANDDSKTYGTLKTFSSTAFTQTGLVTANGDTISGVTETSTGAPVSATVGNYVIVASAATGTGLSNYTIQYVKGTLTVTSAATSLVLSTSTNLSVPGQYVTFTATVSAASGGPPVGTITFKDGSTVLAADVPLSGGIATISVAFLTLGTHTITATYTPSPNFTASGPASVNQSVQTTALLPGPQADQWVLHVGGTNADDNIDVHVKKPNSGPDQSKVHIHTQGVAGEFNTGWVSAPSGSIIKVVAYGNDGDDDISVDDQKPGVSAWLFGGADDDRLKAGKGSAVLVGGDGNDELKSGDGPSVLIGGTGCDEIEAGKGNALLIGGYTDYDAPTSLNFGVLDSLLSAITLGGSTPPASLLNSSTIHDDGCADELSGGNGMDWFFANLTQDVLKKRKAGDLTVDITGW